MDLRQLPPHSRPTQCTLLHALVLNPGCMVHAGICDYD